MSIKTASRRLEALSCTARAGAAPTDVGRITCFQVFVHSAAELTDDNRERVTDVVRSELCDAVEGNLRVTASRDVVDEGTPDEAWCFWVYAYGSFGSFVLGSVEYDVVAWYPERGVDAVPSEYADPLSADAEPFRWEDIPLTIDDVRSE